MPKVPNSCTGNSLLLRQVHSKLKEFAQFYILYAFKLELLIITPSNRLLIPLMFQVREQIVPYRKMAISRHE